MGDGAHLSPQSDFADDHQARIHIAIAETGHHRHRHPQIGSGFIDAQAPGGGDIGIQFGEGNAHPFFQHRQDLQEAIVFDARGRSPGRTVAGGANERLQLHNDRAGAFAGDNRGATGGRFIAIAQKQLRGIGDFIQALIRHFKHADFVGRPKAIFDRAQEAMTSKAIALKIQHRIHQVLQHLRPRDRPFFGDVPDDEQGNILALG